MRPLLFSCLLLLCVGCAAAPKLPPRSPLAIRELQTRNYTTQDTRLVMKALLNVLQDEGFMTRNAVTDLGLITATREENAYDGTTALLRGLAYGPDATWQQTIMIEATANVSEFGRDTRVRVSFQRKVIDNRGAVMSVTEIEDSRMYQEFFTKLDQGLFIQRQRI